MIIVDQERWVTFLCGLAATPYGHGGTPNTMEHRIDVAGEEKYKVVGRVTYDGEHGAAIKYEIAEPA